MFSILSVFKLFLFNLGNHLNSYEKISLFFLCLTLVTSCIIGPFILDNLFALKLNFPYNIQPSQVRIFISNWAHSRDSKSKFEATLYIQGFMSYERTTKQIEITTLLLPFLAWETQPCLEIEVNSIILECLHHTDNIPMLLSSFPIKIIW